MSKFLRKNDQVIVVAGNDCGKVGKVLSVRGDRIVVEGVNVRKKHMKRTQGQQKGQIIDIEVAIHRSNVRPCVDNAAVKLRVRQNEKGEKELYYLDQKGKQQLFRSVMRGSK